MKTILIIFGGASSEHEVSLISAHGVLSNIDRAKFLPLSVGITKSGEWFAYNGDIANIKDGSWTADRECKIPCALLPGRILQLFYPEDTGGHRQILCDAAFPVVHGKNCEDGRLQGYLDIVGLPYVGPGCESSAVCMDKDITKLLAKRAGVRVAPSVTVGADALGDEQKLIKRLEKFGYPLFVKPCRAGSSVGVSKVKSSAELFPAVKLALAADDSPDLTHIAPTAKVLIEKAVRGSEIEVAVLWNRSKKATISPPAEVISGADFYDYEAKYKSDTSSYYIPARISESAARRVRALAKKIFAAVGAEGLSRVDFFVDGENIIFNEINTLPGFTPISMYPKLAAAAGVSYSELITKLIEGAIDA